MEAFLIALGVLVVVLLMRAPFETLTWWSQQDVAERRDDSRLVPARAPVREARSWIVYLSGIGIAGVKAPAPEQPLLSRLRAALADDTVIVSDVYPYSVLGRGLTQGRRWSWLWRGLDGMQRRHWPVLPYLINAYNVLQVLVSADRRYGPIFNLGLARAIWGHLRDAGYDPRSGAPVVLLGWSGGAQISAGAAWYLGARGIPVSLVSLGGVISSDPGLDRLDHVWHLEGSRDRVMILARWVFPSKWPIVRRSAWNRLRRTGRLTTRAIGPMGHMVPPTYLSRRPLPDGRSPIDLSVTAIRDVLVEAGLARARSDTPGPTSASYRP